MARYCIYNTDHKETEVIPARGHDYQNNGLCECGDEPTLPTLPDSGYVNITDPNSGIMQPNNGSEDPAYNRYVLSVDGYYTAETAYYSYSSWVSSNNNFQLVSYEGYVCWIEFSISEAGQYAIVTKGNPNGLTLTRYDADSNYVNTTSPLESRVMSDGSLISTVNCDAEHFSTSWITACCFEGTEAGQTVDFTIVKIDEPAWTSTTVYEEIEAKQINGKVAPEGSAGEKPTEVPYSTSGIFLDEETGYYCMPNGDIIYAAISMPASRQFAGGTTAFSNLLANTDRNFKIHMETMPNGNHLVYDYKKMLLKQPNGLETENNANSYEAMANSDGLYPVTQELYEFLVLHAKNHTPAVAPDSQYKDNAWLAVCYYYKAMIVGSEEYPEQVTLSDDKTFTVTQFDEDTDYYFTLAYTGSATSVTISINTYNVRLFVGNDDSYVNTEDTLNIQNVEVDVSDLSNIVFHCFDTLYENREIEIVIDVVAN